MKVEPYKSKCLYLVACAEIMGFLFSGCQQYNVAYTPLVPDSGAQIVTRNKYRIVGYAVKFESGKEVRVHSDWLNEVNDIFALSQPGVFSSAGVPVGITQNLAQFEQLDSWGGITVLIPFLVSATTLPCIMGGESSCSWEISVNGGSQINQIKLHHKGTTAMTGFTPIALILPMDDEYEPRLGYCTFHKHGRSGLNCGTSQHVTEYQALAYGIAVRLKEMEDAGLIDSAPGRANVRPSVPLSSDPVISTSVSTHRPKPPVSEKPVVRRDRKVEVPVQNKTSNQSYEVENLTFQ